MALHQDLVDDFGATSCRQTQHEWLVLCWIEGFDPAWYRGVQSVYHFRINQ